MATCHACSGTFTEGIPICPHCGSENTGLSAEEIDPLIGRVLANKYRVLAVLGEGGMGKVYRAEQVPLGVTVVIKTLHAHLARTPGIAERFYREAKAASQLRHPNCIAVLDFGESDDVLYIAMEFLRGKSLGDLLEETNKLPPERVIHIAKQILDVVEAAHRISIVHRDLKPDNIMVEDLATQRDFVKVLDFGIAKITDPLKTGAAKLTGTGMVIGTPAYMAPEQAQGQDVDARSDIYSIGVICYELLSGRLPFLAESPAEILAAHVLETPTPLADVAPAVPANLAAVIDGALAKNPDKRPQSALDLKKNLEAVERELLGITETGPGAAGTGPGQAAGGRHQAVQALYPPCPRCGTPVPPSAKFCGDCGAATGRQTRSSTGLSDRFADLRRYLPSSVVDELGDVEVARPGEQREIVTLVIDISGPLLHDDPETAQEVVNKLHDELTRLALKNGGHVERRPDDSFAVLFGLSMTHGDDAERAVRTTLELRARLTAINESLPRPLQMSAAVHAGMAVVRPSKGEASYTPVGDTISLPTRLAGTVEPGLLVATDRIRKLTEGCAAYRRGTAIRLKGHRSAIAVHEILDVVRAGAGKNQFLATPTLIGRDAQLEQLQRLVEENAAGSVVKVVGEPGSGKSRFLAELARRISEHDHFSVLVDCRSSDGPVSLLISTLVRVFGGSGDALRALGVPSDDARILTRYLASRDGRLGALDEKDTRIAVVAATRSMLETVAQRRHVAILLDDINAGDAITNELVLRQLTAPIAGSTIIASTRKGYPMPWDGIPEQEAVLVSEMAPLAKDAIAALVKEALAPTPPKVELLKVVADRAGGSPLMALELLRAMIDSGVLSGSGGRWTITGSLDDIPSPRGLEGIFAARVDALPTYARDMLVCASALGDEFSIEVVDKLLSSSHGMPVNRVIEQLTGKGFLETTEDPKRLRFVERAAREAVYSRLTGRARARVHGALATVIESMFAQLALAPEELGDHFRLGNSPALALTWYGRAADQAIAAGETGRAVDVLRKALTVGRARATGPSAAEACRRVAEDSIKLAEILLEAGQLRELGEVVADGLASAARIDDSRLLVALRRSKGRALLAVGKIDEGLQELEAALEASMGFRDAQLLANLHVDIGEGRERKGELEVASSYLLRGLELVQGAGAEEVQKSTLRVLTALGRVSLRTGQTDRAERFLNEALSLAEALDEPQWAAKVLGNIGGIHHARKQYPVAIKFVERALELSRDCGDQVGAARQHNNLGTLCLLVGNSGAAKRHFDQAYRLAHKAGWREGMAAASAGRAQIQ